LTVLAYVAACTSSIRIGSTVVIVPYRNPVLQAKIFASLDVLSKGRAVCGVGVGWLEKEFETLDVPYSERGPMTNEWLEIFTNLWSEQEPVYSGNYYSYDGIFFEPKPVQQPRMPIWVGGHTRRALRRTAKYGDAWHPSRQTPEYVTRNLPYLYEQVEAEGRRHDDITISLKRSLHISDIGVSGGGSGGNTTGAGISADTQSVIEDIKKCADIGIHQLTYDFPMPDIEECMRILEHFAEKVAPAAS
jgi:probable F420-dependent oxidoreductase